MSTNPNPTPAWGTPTGTFDTGTTPPAAETQVLPPVTQVPPRGAGPVGPRPVDAMQLRVTALHYAQRIIGDQPTANPDGALSTVLRIAKGVENYLLTGNVG